jgi:hypothetical protein
MGQGRQTFNPSLCFLETAASEPSKLDAKHTALLSFHWTILISIEEIQ